ncbi:DNA primase [Acidobacteria bacterium AH-259-A15]|nr:DNA primase [Acidobacteria bacterium AH-259-A15]
MRFDDAFIDQVRNSISIVDLVSGYVRLKKKGKDYAALCPVHHEKTPSFLVSETKRIFKCFGCGVGGDVFKFIMLMENLTFPESVEHLAERHGIPIPRSSKKAEVKSEHRQRLLGIMEIATQFFCRCLSSNDEALAYLRDRQISAETLKQFSIGYAPSGQRLLDELRKQGFTVEEALTCGLVKEGDSGRYYDKFRNRIMFPIRDLSGRSIAFGGRILREGLPKYLNSPETTLYRKGNNLFPLEVTRDEIRRRDFAILVEGYFDCVVPFQFKIRNLAASLGTSLTENQVRVLGRYTRNVVINYDPDSAGTAAAMRSIDLFLEQGFRVNVLQLPSGEDPDTFVRREGGAAYWEKVKASQPYLDFALCEFIDEQKDPFSPKGKQEIVSQILPYLVKIPNKVERAEYLTRIASRLQLDENLIMLEMRRMPQRKGGAPQLKLSPLVDRVTPAENTLLTAILDEDWAAIAYERLEPELFEGLRTEQIFQKVFQLKEENRELTAVRLRELVTDDADRDLIEGMALRSREFPLSEEMVRSSVQALRRKQYERLSRQVQEEIKKEERANSKSDRIDQLLIQKEDIRRKIKEVESAPVLLSPEGSRE